jgi:GTP-binding protein
MLVDDVTIHLKAGKGGDGCTAFQKVKLMQGPTGADGGNGASIYLEAVSDINALQYYASKREIKAEDGKNGRGQFIDGRRGEDLVLKVPRGTRVTNLKTGTVRELNELGERLLVCGGGKGGRGNFKFRGPSNTSPEEHEEGTLGDESDFRFELLLIADVGLVGLPNAGKSSLLNALTNAKSKVGNYQFTTLEPHLGDFYGIILADIPGLIEGASHGKGLGIKFLKHIERTKTLFHLVSAESDDVVRDYKTIRAVLGEYDKALLEKPEHVFLAKSDMIDAKELKERIAKLKKIKVAATSVTILDDESLEMVKKMLRELA